MLSRSAVSVLLWLLGLFLLWEIPSLRRKARSNAGVEQWPSLSVIIPARNEAQRISALLTSLAKQVAVVHEIIVVDDGSSDGTADVAKSLGATVLSGQPLPAGWSGKNWACWQGAEHSTGELLLFLDADTWLEADATISLMQAHAAQKGLLTVQPYHVTCAAYEQVSAFFNVVVMAAVDACTPLRRRLRPGGGFGPCMLCSRKDYFALGGHSTVKGQVLEEIALAGVASRRGLPVTCYGGRGAISFRMYPNGFRDLVEGWSKGFGSGAFAVQIPFLLLTIAWVTGCFRAWVDPLRILLTPRMPGIALAALVYILYALQVAWMLARIGRFRWWTSAFFPIPLVFFALVMLRSLVLIHILRRVKWRGRTITTSRKKTESR